MKTIKNILGLVLALIVATTFNSCEKEVVYEPAEKLDSEQVYFPDYNPSTLEIDGNSTDYFFEVDIARVNTEGALTVPLTVEWADEEADQSLLNFPSSVAFEDGEKVVSFQITYDLSDFDFDEFYDVTIAIANPEELTPYGIHAYEVKIGLPAPWKSLGEGYFMEDLITTFWTVIPHPYKVEIQEHDLFPGLYRLVNPFGKAYKYNDPGDWDDSKDWYIEINAEDPECVYVMVQPTGMDWGYGMIHVGSIGGFRLAQGWTTAEIKAGGLAGTLKNGVISFPPNQMLIGMEDFNDFGKYPANGDGLTKVALPGHVLADYALDIAYAGKYTNAKDDAIGAMCVITEGGDDIETIRIALVQGTDVDAAIEGILDESIESVLVRKTDGYFPETPIMVPFADEPEDGDYTLVAVGFDSETEDQAFAASQFVFTASEVKEQWEAKFVGDYEHSIFYEDFVQKDVVLYQSLDDPLRWKIDDWGMGVDFVFTYDNTGKLTVLEQEIGYVHPTHGTVYVMELPDYSSETADLDASYFEDGVFYFSVVYFVDGGRFGYGYETFTLTGQASAPMKQKANAANRIKAKLPTIKSMVSHKELKKNVSSLQLVR